MFESKFRLTKIRDGAGGRKVARFSSMKDRQQLEGSPLVFGSDHGDFDVIVQGEGEAEKLRVGADYVLSISEAPEAEKGGGN